MENISKEEVSNYRSIEGKIFRRCKDIGEYYFEEGLWKRGINYICGFDIVDDKIEIFEGAHGMDLEFNLEDFYNDEELIKVIKKDIEESK